MKVNKSLFNKLKNMQYNKKSIELIDFNNLLKQQAKTNDKYYFNIKIFKSEKNKNEIYKIVFIGKHYSRNVIGNWHRGKLLKYKKAIKEGSKKGFILNKHLLPTQPLTKINIKYEVYNPISRDDDANYDTLKWMRDTLTVNKLILDDNRTVINNTTEKEIIDKEYKIIIYVENLNS